jgi:hypothetical protein
MFAWFWVQATVDSLFGFSSVVYIWNEDSVTSTVKSFLDSNSVVVSIDSDEGLGLTITDSDEHIIHGISADWAVLEINQKPVVSTVRKLLCDNWGARVQKDSEFSIPLLEALLELLSCLLGN